MCDVHVPAGKMPLQMRLIAPQHCEIDVPVLTRLPSEEEIDRPATSDPPGRVKAFEQRVGTGR